MLVSATGSNLRTLLDMARRAPDMVDVPLVVAHGPHAPAVEVARSAGVETWVGDYDEKCGRRSEAAAAGRIADYEARAREWHDRLDERIEAWERVNGRIDLVVLAYHRLIQGNLLARYRHRMVNVHPADLTVLTPDNRRMYVGTNPVAQALADGRRATRTSCFFVTEGIDTGPIICMGPQTPVCADETAKSQELRQKAMSDRPALRWAVERLAEGRISVSTRTHRDGSHAVMLDGQELQFGGQSLAAHEDRREDRP
ncbi:formyltransferase family protein [Cellulomonas cellasea]|nr:formyltransferase family protein [Cellulomonas cellasea]MDM8085104.1 formyltransferase family protein [Cellulomonas cellasea]